jgi:hypothetical protein
MSEPASQPSSSTGGVSTQPTQVTLAQHKAHKDGWSQWRDGNRTADEIGEQKRKKKQRVLAFQANQGSTVDSDQMLVD